MAEPNLSSILASRQLTSDALHRKCSETHLATIAQSITSWKQLSPFLGLTQQDEDDIQSDNTRNAERKLAMMRRWKEKYGDEATYFRLADAFEALKWRNCISELLDLFQQEHQSLGNSASPISTSKTEPVSPLDETPKPNQLIRLVGRNGEQISIRDHLAGNWEDLFLCMNFEPAEENQSMMAVIKRNNAGKVEDACRDVLLKWLAGGGCKPVTWATFIEVLRDMGEPNLADKIKGIMLSQTPS